ncbi:hypothetical protein MMC21_003705 [Puttea exsequens]|nr:hypothetical protein [Puttea exsequens]
MTTPSSSTASKQPHQLPVTDERNDQIEDTEDAPLMHQSDNSDNNDTENAAPPHSRTISPRSIQILTPTALALSVLTLLLLIATQVALQLGPRHFSIGWQVEDSMKGLIAPSVLSLLFTTYNLVRLRSHRSAAPLPVSLILDIIIGLIALGYGLAGLPSIADGGYCYSYPHNEIDQDACMRRALPARLVAGVALGAGVLMGLVHLLMVALRGVVVVRSEAWKGPWGFPNGQVTIEFNLKMFKEPQVPKQAVEEAV